jgi:hypothetical protein
MAEKRNRTSVYLTDALRERVDAAGVPLGRLIALGLDAAERQPVTADELRRVLREEFGDDDTDAMRETISRLEAELEEATRPACPDCGTALACPRCYDGG